MKKLPFFSFLLALSLALPFGAAQAQTEISGSIASPSWTAEHGPYIVDGTIQVLPGATLTMEPGVLVRFKKDAKLVVHGTLVIKGEASNPVVLTSAEAEPSRGDWGGIEFSEDSADAVMSSGQYVSGSTIQYAVLQFSNGIVADDASPYIANSQMRVNTVGISITGDNASDGALVLIEGAAVDNVSEIKPLYARNNTIEDNVTGIQVNRNNGQNHTTSRTRYTYTGDQINTAWIQDNEVRNNRNGIVIANGDSNVIAGNTVRYNTENGVILQDGSRSNSLEKNIIRNNAVGIIAGSPDTSFIQNSILYNASVGITITALENTVSNNNIYGNGGFNARNAIRGMSYANNYWGTTTGSVVTAGIDAVETIGTYEPYATATVSLVGVSAPVVNAVTTPTSAASQILSGIRPVGSSVFVNGQRAVLADNRARWEYEAPLTIGANAITIRYEDANRAQGTEAMVRITREQEIIVPAPTVDAGSYEARTSRSRVTLTGDKEPGVGILVYDVLEAPVDSSSAWEHDMPLAIGTNTITIEATDGAGRKSATVTVVIERTEVDVSGVVAEEKRLTVNTDSALAKRLSGRLLLQVENKGQIWYVDPKTGKRFFVTKDSAIEIFRALSLGITEADLGKVPVKGSLDPGDAGMRNRLKGKLLLRVQASGQIVYVDFDGFRHEATTENVMDLFRSLSLGITNKDLRKLEVGEL